MLMSSQLPALYLRDGNEEYVQWYVRYLNSLGFTDEEAHRLFDWESGVIQRFDKGYLKDPKFVKTWLMGLSYPFFREYPCTQEDILKERFLTVSELCKLIDEAEWHFWNSHERELPDAVWTEICAFRLRAQQGMSFAIAYFNMISEETGISNDHLARLSSAQAVCLNRYKWG